VRAAEGRVEDRDRRNCRQEDHTGGAGISDQLAHDQRHRRQCQAREDERRQAQRLEPRPPALQDVLQPEMQRAAAPLRRDDVEDVAEREVRDAQRQLFVDVERRPPDRPHGFGDEQRSRRHRR